MQKTHGLADRAVTAQCDRGPRDPQHHCRSNAKVVAREGDPLLQHRPKPRLAFRPAGVLLQRRRQPAFVVVGSRVFHAPGQLVGFAGGTLRAAFGAAIFVLHRALAFQANQPGPDTYMRPSPSWATGRLGIAGVRGLGLAGFDAEQSVAFQHDATITSAPVYADVQDAERRIGNALPAAGDAPALPFPWHKSNLAFPIKAAGLRRRLGPAGASQRHSTAATCRVFGRPLTES
jgi:hypothetical protein